MPHANDRLRGTEVGFRRYRGEARPRGVRGCARPDDDDKILDLLAGKVTNPVVAVEIEARCSVMGTTKCDIRDLVFPGLALDAGPGGGGVETRCDAALSPAQ